MSSLLKKLKRHLGIHFSGGIRYSIRRTRYKTLHKSYFAFCHKWIKDIPWDFKKPIALIGPNTGSALPKNWLNQFTAVYVSEPDLISLNILKFKHSAQFHLLPDLPLDTDVSIFIERLNDLGIDQILFCNILGQLTLDMNDIQEKEFKTALTKGLSKFEIVASFHDRISFVIQKHSKIKTPHYNHEGHDLDIETLLKKAKEKIEGAIIEASDHCTEKIVPSVGVKDYFLWQLTPTQIQCVEFVKHLNQNY